MHYTRHWEEFSEASCLRSGVNQYQIRQGCSGYVKQTVEKMIYHGKTKQKSPDIADQGIFLGIKRDTTKCKRGKFIKKA